jgi:hypothetical protein
MLATQHQTWLFPVTNSVLTVNTKSGVRILEMHEAYTITSSSKNVLPTYKRDIDKVLLHHAYKSRHCMTLLQFFNSLKYKETPQISTLCYSKFCLNTKLSLASRSMINMPGLSSWQTLAWGSLCSWRLETAFWTFISSKYCQYGFDLYDAVVMSTTTIHTPEPNSRTWITIAMK